MKSRKEILTRRIIEEDYTSSNIRAILEVLLDIRDLLTSKE